MSKLATIANALKILRHVFRRIFKRPFTYFYPWEDRYYPDRTRGRHIHVRENCTACSQCVRACPVIAIRIDKEDKKYEKDAALYFDYSRCIFCGLCVDACRFDALFHTPIVGLSQDSQEKMIYGPDRITKVEREPLEWRGRKIR
jgi:formate hydrogenlyase subunit 6/NADH:ubiquinone oxidoreductase subunit I